MCWTSMEKTNIMWFGVIKFKNRQKYGEIYFWNLNNSKHHPCGVLLLDLAVHSFYGQNFRTHASNVQKNLTVSCYKKWMHYLFVQCARWLTFILVIRTPQNKKWRSLSIRPLGDRDRKYSRWWNEGRAILQLKGKCSSWTWSTGGTYQS